jgi:hypothetical protein
MAVPVIIYVWIVINRARKALDDGKLTPLLEGLCGSAHAV